MLISVGTSLSIFCQGQIRLNGPKDPDLILPQTQLGCMLGGSALPNSYTNTSQSPIQCNLASELETTVSEFDVKKFWELEKVPTNSPGSSQEEELCEAHIKENAAKDDSGRYIVSLPFNENRSALCDTKGLADARLKSLLRKFSRNRELEQR